MPAPSRTWTHSWNNAPTSQASFLAQNSEFLYTLKAALVSAGWTVIGSSAGDGINFKAIGGEAPYDFWANSGDVIWNTPGGVLDVSWITLQSPSGYPSAGNSIYFTISCGLAAGNEDQAIFSFATSTPTGGSDTDDPTQPAGSSFQQTKQVFPATLANSKYHIHYNTDGDFFAFVSEDGKGYAAFGIASLEAINGDTGVNYPWIGIASYDDADPGAFEEANIRNATQGVMFWQDGTPYTASNTWGLCQIYCGAQNLMTYYDSNGSDISTEYPDLPVILASRQAGEVGIFGVITDVGVAPTGTGIVQGSELPGSPAASTRTLVGEFWFPNGGTTPSF